MWGWAKSWHDRGDTWGALSIAEKVPAVKQNELYQWQEKLLASTGHRDVDADVSEAFREDLAPLLENIHGDTRHCGKTPRRLPQTKQTQSELVQLRKQLTQAIHKEAYEEAAQIRDRIRKLEEG